MLKTEDTKTARKKIKKLNKRGEKRDMMTDQVKDILLNHLDSFLKEVGVIADGGEFVVGDATSSHMADAVEVVWNSMSYSAKLESQEMLKFEPEEKDLE